MLKRFLILWLSNEWFGDQESIEKEAQNFIDKDWWVEMPTRRLGPLLEEFCAEEKSNYEADNK